MWVYRLRAPKMRTMTVKEGALWASSPESIGWVYGRGVDYVWYLPAAWDYEEEPKDLQRARIDTLNNDGTGGEWEAFEVATCE